MLLLTVSTWSALFLSALLPSALLGAGHGSYKLTTKTEACEVIERCVRLGNVKGLQGLFQHSYWAATGNRMTPDILPSVCGSYVSAVAMRYLLCQNQKALLPFTPEALKTAMKGSIAQGCYKVAKLILCHPLLPSVTAIEMIESCETSIGYPFMFDDEEEATARQDRHGFVEFCTRWARLIFECRDGQTDLLDAWASKHADCKLGNLRLDTCAPGQLDDGVVNLLLDATFFGCQRHKTHQLATLLLGKYARASMAELMLAHKAAIEKGLIHVAALLKLLGRFRRVTEAPATSDLVVPELILHIHCLLFTEQHHKLYEEWHAGPHQKDVEQSLASVEAEEHS